MGALDELLAHPEWPAELIARAVALRAAVRAVGWEVPEGRSPIIPLIVGDEANALELAAKLRALGHYAPAIRPPTVPEGACRLRLTLTLAHTEADRRRLVMALSSVRSTSGERGAGSGEKTNQL